MLVNALPSSHTPAVFTIAAPEGLRGHVQNSQDEVGSFSQQDYEKFLEGYKSQYKELSFWVDEDAIEGIYLLLCSGHFLCFALCCWPIWLVHQTAS